jgi:hypothetical protein
MLVRRLVFNYRYPLQAAKLLGKPDLVFGPRRKVITTPVLLVAGAAELVLSTGDVSEQLRVAPVRATFWLPTTVSTACAPALRAKCATGVDPAAHWRLRSGVGGARCLRV